MHLIKLSVGPEKLSDLAGWQAQRLAEQRTRGRTPELMHITRQTPKRADELLDGGSIYWVIKGYIVARQTLQELRPVLVDGVPHCALVLGHDLVRVVPRKHRPFQGWRYFAPDATPPDLAPGENYSALAEPLQRELAEAGLL